MFVSEKPLIIEQIKKVLDNIEANEIQAFLDELKTDYEQANRGIRIIEVAGGFQMITSTNFAPFLKKFFKERHIEKLSKPGLQTLAIIAYKQPLTKLEIESLRNVNVDGVMKSLRDKNLIRIVGRKKAAGRPFVFGTTKQFLEYFGLKSLDDLPKMQDFSKMAEKREEIEPILENEAKNLPEGINEPRTF